jgi:prefoldin subunit 5
MEEMLDEANAEIERLRAALEIIAGRRQCIDALMSNVAIAEAALNHVEGVKEGVK